MKKILLREMGIGAAGELIYIDTQKQNVVCKRLELTEGRSPSARIRGYIRELVDTGTIEYINKMAKETRLVLGRKGGKYIVHSALGLEYMSADELLEVSDKIRVDRELVDEWQDKVEDVGKTLGDIERELDATLWSSKEVRLELFKRTGIIATKIMRTRKVVTTLRIYLSGIDVRELNLRLDRGNKGSVSVIDGKVDKLRIGGGIAELTVEEASTVYIDSEDSLSCAAKSFRGVIGHVELGKGVGKYSASTKSRYRLSVEAGSRLKKLEGYCGTVCDLSEALELRYLEGCFNYYGSTWEVNRAVLDVKYPRSSKVDISRCFTNVDLSGVKGLVQAGILDIDGVLSIEFSFHNFIGVEDIRGVVEGAITNSFKSDDYTGTFDVGAEWISGSFRTITKADKKVEAKGKLRLNGESKEFWSNTIGDSQKIYWKQEVEVMSYLSDAKVELSQNQTVIFREKVGVLRVQGNVGLSGQLVLMKKVDTLAQSQYPYANVEEYGDNCFYSQKSGNFARKDIVELPEGLVRIGARAFSKAQRSPKYLVIPRSCISFGTNPFGGYNTLDGVPVTICVYKDSEAERQLKRRNINLKVIDSVEELKVERVEVENTEIYNLVDDCRGYNLSSKLVYNLSCLVEDRHISNYKVVGSMPADVGAQLKRVAKPEYDRYDLAPDWTIPKAYRGILAGTLTESDLGLLTKRVVDNCNWKVMEFGGVRRYTGESKLKGYVKDEDKNIVIYMSTRSSELYYVGCPMYIYNDGGIEVDKIYKGEAIITDDLESKLVLTYTHNIHGTRSILTVRAYGEDLSGKALINFREYMKYNLTEIDEYKHATKGRRVYYDYLKNKIYAFQGSLSSSGLDGVLELVKIYSVKDWLANDKDIQKSLKELKAKELGYKEASEIKLSTPEVGGISWEIKYARDKGKKLMDGVNVDIGSLQEFLKKSKLVKKVRRVTDISNLLAYSQLLHKNAAGKCAWEIVTPLKDGEKTDPLRYILIGTESDGPRYEEIYTVGFDVYNFLKSYGINEAKPLLCEDRFGVNISKENIVDVWGSSRGREYTQNTRVFLGLDKDTGKLLLVCGCRESEGAEELWMSLWAFESSAKGVAYLRAQGYTLYGKNPVDELFRDGVEIIGEEGSRKVVFRNSATTEIALIQKTMLALGCKMTPRPRWLNRVNRYDKLVIDYARL